MIIVASIIMVLAALYFLIYPIFRPKAVADVPDDTTLRDLVAQKDTLYSTLAELRMDYEMGNLSPSDHAQLEEKYKEKAVAVLKKLDMASEDIDLDAEIERQVARMRRGRPRPVASEVDVDEAIEQEVLRLRQGSKRTLANCPNCGHEIGPTAKFCPDCGTALRRTCPNCDASVTAEAHFCSRCGASLEVRRSDG